MGPLDDLYGNCTSGDGPTQLMRGFGHVINHVHVLTELTRLNRLSLLPLVIPSFRRGNLLCWLG